MADVVLMKMDEMTAYRVAILLIRYRLLVRSGVRAFALYAVALGIGTFVGGDDRFRGPSYRSAWDLAATLGTSPSILWGIFPLICGLLVLWPRRRVSQVGLFLLMVHCSFLAIGFAISVNTEPLAGVSGIFAHALIALSACAFYVIRMVDRAV